MLSNSAENFLQHITSKEVQKVMTEVERIKYNDKKPLEDFPQYVGFGASFPSPQTHAVALETLREYLKPGSRVLDVGSGSGYLSVCLALMVGPTGQVVAIEHIPELLNRSIQNVMRDRPYLLTSNRLKFIEGDGRRGVPDYAPYDVINVGAVTLREHVPIMLLKQLKPGGRLITPADRYISGMGCHMLMVVDKLPNGTIVKNFDENRQFQTMCEWLTSKKEQIKWDLHAEPDDSMSFI